MSKWGSELLDKISKRATVFKRMDEHTLRAETHMGMVHQHIWLEKEERSFATQFPALTCSIIENTLGENIKRYNLYVKKDESFSHLITIKCPGKEQKGVASCYVSQGLESDPDIPVASLKQAFSEWFTQLPAYRLHFVTGDWEVEVKS